MNAWEIEIGNLSRYIEIIDDDCFNYFFYMMLCVWLYERLLFILYLKLFFFKNTKRLIEKYEHIFYLFNNDDFLSRLIYHL